MIVTSKGVKPGHGFFVSGWLGEEPAGHITWTNATSCGIVGSEFVCGAVMRHWRTQALLQQKEDQNV